MDIAAPLTVTDVSWTLFLLTRSEEDPLYCDIRDTFLSVFILCPVFQMRSLSFHIQSNSSSAVMHPCHEINLNRPSPLRAVLAFSLSLATHAKKAGYSSSHSSWSPVWSTIMLTKQMCWTVNNAVLTLTIFDSSCQVQICLFKSFIGKMRYYLREKQSSKTVPTLHLNTKKKKVFINLNEHIFPDICAFICCVCFYIILYMNITHSDDISEPFQEHLGKLKCQLFYNYNLFFFSFVFSFVFWWSPIST